MLYPLWHPDLMRLYNMELRFIALGAAAPFEHGREAAKWEANMSVYVTYGVADVLLRACLCRRRYENLAARLESAAWARRTGEFIVERSLSSFCTTYGDDGGLDESELLRFSPEKLRHIQEEYSSLPPDERERLRKGRLVVGEADLPTGRVRSWMFLVAEIRADQMDEVVERIQTVERLTPYVCGLYTGKSSGIFRGSQILIELDFPPEEYFAVPAAIEGLHASLPFIDARTQSFLLVEAIREHADRSGFTPTLEIQRKTFALLFPSLNRPMPVRRQAQVLDLCQQWQDAGVLGDDAVGLVGRDFIDHMIHENARGYHTVVLAASRLVERELRQVYQAQIVKRYGREWHDPLKEELGLQNFPGEVDKWPLGLFVDLERRLKAHADGALTDEDIGALSEFNSLRGRAAHFVAGLPERDVLRAMEGLLPLVQRLAEQRKRREGAE